jgi:hypothetical protein
LSFNRSKTVVILFIKKRALKGLKEPILFSKTMQLSTEVKYLGITLDKGLTGVHSWIKSLVEPTEIFGPVASFGKT